VRSGRSFVGSFAENFLAVQPAELARIVQGMTALLLYGEQFRFPGSQPILPVRIHFHPQSLKKSVIGRIDWPLPRGIGRTI
jgi:hypothetical protein